MPPPSPKSVRWAYAAAFLAAAVAASALANFEPSGESWGYWFFARRMAAHFEAVSPDRSPLYTLWLQPFRAWLAFPLSMTVEYLVGAFFTACAFAWLLEPSVGLAWASLISAGWIPYLQTAEPVVQRVAFGAAAAAVAVRRLRGGIPVGYALMLAAVMFRGSYKVMLLGFLAYDAWRFVRGKLPPLGSKLAWLPLAALVGLSAAFAAHPSPHRWSNSWQTDMDWIPFKSQKLIDVASLGHISWTYIEQHYGGPRDRDIWFTHREMFGEGADSLGQAVRANPKMILFHLYHQVKAAAGSAIALSSVPTPMRRRWTPWLIVGALMFGAWKMAERSGDPDFRVFLAVCVVTACLVTAIKAKGRYYPSLVPLFSLGAWWLGERAGAALGGRLRGTLARRAALAAHALVVVAVCGGLAWADVFGDVVYDLRHDGVRLLQAREGSMEKAFPAIADAARGCKGVMTLEAHWFAAFLPSPAPEVYSVWEIPPFGRLGDKPYDGLRPDRIDCLFISPGLETDEGWGTNQGIRWRGHIEPYERRLLALGARRRDIPGYGRAIVLSPDARKP